MNACPRAINHFYTRFGVNSEEKIQILLHVRAETSGSVKLPAPIRISNISKLKRPEKAID